MACARGCCDSPAEHFRSLQFGGMAPSRASAVEKQWEKDMPAYKRLRANGLQPKNIDGCATLESRAETVEEISAGKLLNKRQQKQLKKVLGEVA